MIVQNYKGYIIYAWCKDASLPLLLEKDFTPGEIVTYVEKKKLNYFLKNKYK